MASIKDVAQKAGVGVGTVSRVLNNSGYVSDETREKIEEAMKNLQYTPNELARNLYHIAVQAASGACLLWGGKQTAISGRGRAFRGRRRVTGVFDACPEFLRHF